MTTLTAQRLRELLCYTPETGEFARRVKTANSRPDRVGGISTSGYYSVSLESKRHYLHRLAWLYMTGEWPNIIDHINGNRLDNRWANLRNVGRVENAQNVRAARTSSETGYLGVQACRANKNFRASIMAHGVRKSLGRFGTPEEAHAAYLDAKRELHQGNTL